MPHHQQRSQPGPRCYSHSPNSTPKTGLLVVQAGDSSDGAGADVAGGSSTPAPAAPAPPPFPEGGAASSSGSGPSLSGYAQLLTVPLLWGSYNPAVRFLYMDANPLTPASLTATTTTIAATALVAAAALDTLSSWRRGKQQPQLQAGSAASAGEGGAEAGAGFPLLQPAADVPRFLPAFLQRARLGPVLTRTQASVLLAGLELVSEYRRTRSS